MGGRLFASLCCNSTTLLSSTAFLWLFLLFMVKSVSSSRWFFCDLKLLSLPLLVLSLFYPLAPFGISLKGYHITYSSLSFENIVLYRHQSSTMIFSFPFLANWPTAEHVEESETIWPFLTLWIDGQCGVTQWVGDTSNCKNHKKREENPSFEKLKPFI